MRGDSRVFRGLIQFSGYLQKIPIMKLTARCVSYSVEISRREGGDLCVCNNIPKLTHWAGVFLCVCVCVPKTNRLVESLRFATNLMEFARVTNEKPDRPHERLTSNWRADQNGRCAWKFCFPRDMCLVVRDYTIVLLPQHDVCVCMFVCVGEW